MPDGGDTPRTLDRETLRARREAARRRSRLARRRGLVVVAAALTALVVGVLVAGAGGGGRGHGAAPQNVGGGHAAPRGRTAHGAGSPANLEALVAAGKPVYCGAGRQRLVALTFDDGPGPYTKFAIDELTRAHARATWFLVGRNLQPNAARLPQELALGELGDHTWTHPPLTGLSPDAASSEIQRTRDAVAAAAGRPVRVFRPPYGLRNGGIDDTVRRLGMANIIWSVDSRAGAPARRDRADAREPRPDDPSAAQDPPRGAPQAPAAGDPHRTARTRPPHPRAARPRALRLPQADGQGQPRQLTLPQRRQASGSPGNRRSNRSTRPGTLSGSMSRP